VSALTVQGNFSVTGVGQVALNIAQDVASPVGQSVVVQLASGFNQFTIPAGTTFIVIRLPSSNAQDITMKGVTGDSGLPLNKNGLNIISPASSLTTFGLTAGGAVAYSTVIQYI
jgi:hypothetical protein